MLRHRGKARLVIIAAVVAGASVGGLIHLSTSGGSDGSDSVVYDGEFTACSWAFGEMQFALDRATSHSEYMQEQEAVRLAGGKPALLRTWEATMGYLSRDIAVQAADAVAVGDWLLKRCDVSAKQSYFDVFEEQRPSMVSSGSDLQEVCVTLLSSVADPADPTVPSVSAECRAPFEEVGRWKACLMMNLWREREGWYADEFNSGGWCEPRPSIYGY